MNVNAKLTFKKDRRRGLVVMHVDQTQYGVAARYFFWYSAGDCFMRKEISEDRDFLDQPIWLTKEHAPSEEILAWLLFKKHHPCWHHDVVHGKLLHPDEERA